MKKIKYNKGKNEGYFIETTRGYVQVMIREGEAMELKDITEISDIRINEATLKVEEVKKGESYIG